MPGYALLPTMEAPTSNKTFRLSNEEMRERNEWMFGAVERGLTPQEIAIEVGLSLPRVYQILKKNAPKQERKKRGLYNSPREAALAEFFREDAHPACAKTGSYDMCNDCFGRMMLIESEYDFDGWPYSWAMLWQARYIAQSKPRKDQQ